MGEKTWVLARQYVGRLLMDRPVTQAYCDQIRTWREIPRFIALYQFSMWVAYVPQGKLGNKSLPVRFKMFLRGEYLREASKVA
jgi:SRSO17 transposase